MSFQIKQIQNSESHLKIVEICNGTSSAKIVLSEGASLQELTLNSVPIIQDLYPLTYQDTYASSILFPFASRIEDGKYSFENRAYQTEINELDRSNSLHGFVYNKEFKIVDHQLESDSASIVLEYNETNQTKGFPFTYKMQITYVLQNDLLSLKVNVFNTSKKTFPFTIGWHPYFTSSDLYTSTLKFDSDTKVLFDKGLITRDTEMYNSNSEIKIKDKNLDDCYFLNSNTIEFSTPDYTLHLNSTVENNFLQVYTPPKENVIAIEPTTGISNSFNNKIGLKTLAPNQEFEIAWQLQITNHL